MAGESTVKRGGGSTPFLLAVGDHPIEVRFVYDDGREEHPRGYACIRDRATGRPTVSHLGGAADGG